MYKSSDLSVLAYANNFTLWHYTTTDPVISENYFARANDLLRVKDLIILQQCLHVGIYIVTGRSDTRVTLAPLISSPPLSIGVTRVG